MVKFLSLDRILHLRTGLNNQLVTKGKLQSDRCFAPGGKDKPPSLLTQSLAMRNWSSDQVSHLGAKRDPWVVEIAAFAKLGNEKNGQI
jgi:hypothetical protein